jgi:hypothetical protein
MVVQQNVVPCDLQVEDFSISYSFVSTNTVRGML